MRTPIFTGCCPALATPFHESGEIDYKAFAKLIDHQISAGADAVCVCGTTGEASTLTQAEQEELIHFCVNHVNHRVKVIAGTGSNCTASAIEKSKTAQRVGADAALIVTPYYNKTTQQGLIKHYESLAANVDIPIILYNVPSRTGLSFSVDTYTVLAQIPGINGVKEASGNLSLFTHAKAKCPDDFFFWSGNDDQVVPLMSLGAVGVISAASNVIPEIMSEMAHLCLQGDFTSAAELQFEYAEVLDVLFSEVNPIPIKAAMELFGMCSNTLRLPLCSISTQNLERLQATLSKAELY